MPDEEVVTTTGAFGFVTDDGVEWTPLGKVSEAPLTVAYDLVTEVRDLLDLPKLNPITVSWIDWKFICKYLGRPRLSYVWQYRRWNKGHGNGWTR